MYRWYQKKPTTDTMTAYLQSIPLGEDATKEGYMKSIVGGAHGRRGVREAIDTFNTITDVDQRKAYVAAMSEENKLLGKHLGEVAKQGADATTTLKEYRGSVIKSTAATVGMKAASMALNMAFSTLVSLGVSAILSLAAKGLDNLVHAQEKTAEKAENFTQSMKSMRDETAKNTKTISDLNDRYQELSKGVNSLGENVLLTSQEYDEYKNIISQISGIMPDLNVMYNSNGEAVRIMADNMSDLNAEYREYRKNQALKFLNEGDENGNTVDSLIKDFNNKNDTSGSLDIVRNTMGAGKGVGIALGATLLNILSAIPNGLAKIQGREVKWHNPLSDISEFYMSLQERLDAYRQFEANTDRDDFVKVLSTMGDLGEGMVGHTIEEFKSMSDDEFKEVKENISRNVQSLSSQLRTQDDRIRDQLLLPMITAYSDELTAEQEDLAAKFVSAFDSENLLNHLQDDNGNIDQSRMTEFVQQLLSSIQSDEAAEAISKLIDMNWENSDLPFNTFTEDINGYLDILNKAGIDGELAYSLIEKQTSGAGAALQKVIKMIDGADLAKLYDLSLEDINLASQFEIDDGVILSWDEFNAKLIEARNNATSKDLKAIYDYNKALAENKEILDSFESGNTPKKNGNIDHFNRPIIEWSDIEIEKQRKALETWGYDLDDFKDEYSTILSGYDEFGTNKEFRIAYTPIIDDGSGNGELLTPETLNKYINEVLSKATDENGNVDFDQVLKIDADGFKVDGKTIKNVIGDIALTAESTREDFDALTQSWHEGEQGIYAVRKAENELAKAAKSANTSLALYIDQIHDTNFKDFFNLGDNKTPTTLGNISSELDKVQNAYKTLQSAVQEYNKEGYLSVDTFQSVIGLGGKYLQFLFDENGNLNMNAEALKEVALARVEEIRLKSIDSAISTVEGIKSEGMALTYIKAQNFETAQSYQELAESRLKAWQASALTRGISKEKISQVLDVVNTQISNINSLSEKTAKGINEGLGMTGESAADTNKKLEDTQRQIADLDKKANLDRIKHKFDTLEQSAEKLNNTMSLLDNTLGLISEDDHIGKIQTTTLQLDLAREKAGLLANEFTELQNTEYDSADAANELASRMKSVADEIADNQKNIIEYGKNIAQYYGDALKAVGTLSKTQIDEASNLLDRNIKALEEGGLAGIQFTLSPVATPQSAIEKQRQENKTLEDELKTHYDAVANMQKIALDMQYQETMADYARQREELVKSLNEIKTTLGNNSTEVQGIESDKNKKIAEAEKKSNQERLAEERSFSDQSKGVINDLNNWMKTNPIVAPSLDTTAWEGLVTKAESYAQRIKDAFTGAGTVNALNINKDSDISNLARGAFGNGRNALVEAARSQVGYKANAGKYNKFSEFGVGYGYAYNSAEDWCNDFASWAAVMAGLDDVIPIGAGTIDTAERFKKNLKSAKNYTPKIGDIAYYGSSDSIGGIYHVEIVSGFDENGKLITIGGNTSGGKVVERVRNDYPKFFGTYYNGTGKFNYDGIAGETYEPEYLIDKKTGEATRVISPTPVNTKTTDVVGVKQTKEIEKHKYANGTVDPMDIAKYIRSHYPEVTDNAIAGILGNIEYESSFDQFNKTVEEYGGGNKSLIARRGLFQLDDTRIPNWSSIVASGDWTKQIDTVLAEGRYQNSGMGNSQKHNMWQYLTDSSLSAADVAAKWDSLYERSDGKTRNQRMDKANEYLSQIKSLGLSMDANTSAMSTNVATIAKADVITRIKDLIDSGSSNSSVAGKEGFEDDLVKFIENNLAAGEGTTERLISAFEAMTQTDAEYKEQFKGLIQNLKDSAETADYGDVRAQLSDSVANYTEAILGEQAKYQTIAIKETFDRAQEARQLALDYYNQRKENGAGADELAILAQTISDLDTEIQGYSDQYVSVMSSYTDYLVKGADREMRVYNERISWQDKVNDELQREVDHASSTTEKMSAIDKLTDSYIKKQKILNEKMDAAHQSAEDLRHNAEFSPIFETFDTYAWFDAEGNATAQFERDREALSLSSPELVPLLNRAFELLQKYTQEWQSANEETKQNADLIKDLELDKAQAKVEQYTKNLERLNEIDDVRKSKQDAITAAMEKQHSLAQSLREEISNINAELDANKHTEQWLDEDTRKLIFNDEDYEEELKSINDIQAKANRLYKNYQRDLANLTETEWYKEVKITDEYNKQMDILNEKLNVSKQEIALKKKELEYNNALKERDTRIIVGGHAVMVANPDTMYNLAKERSLTQSELSNTLLTNRESEQERRSDRISQGINQEILAREKMVELLGKMDDAQIKAYANMLPVIDELEMFGNMLSDINVPWMNAHSRDYREQFADLPDIYKISGYNLGYDYAGSYDVVEDLYASGIISDEIMRAYSKQLESQHDLKRSTDINTAQYPDTYLYGGKHYADEYGIDDESRYQEQLLREQSREYSQLAYEINHGRGTQAQLDRIKELNDNNAKDNKYIANTLDTTLYAVNEDGIVVRDGQKIGIDSDSIQEFADAAGNRIGEIVKGAVVTSEMYRESKKGEIAHGDYTPRQNKGEIAHGDYSKYASGTKSAKAGLALTDEEGYELKLKQLGGKFRALDGGEMIFSNPQSANLFEFSQNPPNYIAEQIAKMNGQMASVVTNTDNRKSETHNHFDFGGVVVEHPVDADGLVNGLVQKASSRYDVTKNIRI